MQHTCPNCDQVITGKYCQHCGQAAGVQRITWKYFFAELQNRLFGFDTRFLRTVKDLTIRPETVISASVDGIRVKYFGPLSYYFILITVYVLLMSALEIDMAEYTRSMNFNNEETPEGQVAFQNDMNAYIFGNFRVWSFLMIPFFILGNYFIFKNKGYNYLENGVLVFYTMGHPLLLSIIWLFPFKFYQIGSGAFAIMGISYLYFGWVCARFYSGNKIWNFFKGLLAITLSYILLMLFAMLSVIIFFIINPEVAERTFQE